MLPLRSVLVISIIILLLSCICFAQSRAKRSPMSTERAPVYWAQYLFHER